MVGSNTTEKDSGSTDSPVMSLEGLGIVGLALPVALDPVAQDFMEEDTAGTPGKNGGPAVRFRDRCDSQSLEIGDNLPDRFHDCLVVGHAVLTESEKLLVAGQVHPVVGLRRAENAQPVRRARGSDPGPLAVDVPPCRSHSREGHRTGVNVIGLSERRRVPLELFGPR